MICLRQALARKDARTMRQQRHRGGGGRDRAGEASRIDAEAAPSAPAQGGKPVIFAEAAGEAPQPAKRLFSQPLLREWPAEYRGGGFKIDGCDIVLFARGQPDLRLEG